jgi:tetratricopeptide (TPR) repeat protein
MTPVVAGRAILLGWIAFAAVPFAAARQTGRAVNNANPALNTGATTDGTSTSRRSAQVDAQNQAPRRPTAFITGAVVTSDDSPLPTGIAIERVCMNAVTKEADVSPNGYFSFQLGASTAIQDASYNDPFQWQSSTAYPGLMPAGEPRNLAFYADCSLRAAIGGYRSSSIELNAGQLSRQTNVGTIVLSPVGQVHGTTVSVTELAASKKSKKLVERAAQAMRDKNYEKAQEQLRAALADSPKYATAWLRLGQIARETCRLDDARLALASAIAADKSYVPPYIELAVMASAEKEWEEAADLSGYAMELDPLDYPAGFYVNAIANFNLGRLETAEGSARKVERLDYRHRLLDTYLLLANIMHRKRDLVGEGEQLKEYLKYAPMAADTEKVRSRVQALAVRGR